MRLFEAILDANHRALNGDPQAGVHPGDYKDSLPVVALTCIDPRLNRFFPGVLGLPEEQFIWLRNAGNILTSPMSSTMRSLALACAVKNGREIAIIGHSDCNIRKTPTTALIDRFKAQGIERSRLPENLTEFFGTFASEQQNVIRSVDFVRNSPIIGPKIPVHGLMVDSATGRLEWVVNGYDVLERAVAHPPAALSKASIGRELEDLGTMANFNMGEMKSPAGNIGEIVSQVTERVKERIEELKPGAPQPAAPAHPAPPPQAPPPIQAPPRQKPVPAPPPLPRARGKWGMRD